MIVAGAELCGGIKFLAVQIGMPSLVLALVLAPVATELPEKFNSIIWIGKGYFSLGNITGAMVFKLNNTCFRNNDNSLAASGISLLSGLLVLSSSFILLISVLSTKELEPTT